MKSINFGYISACIVAAWALVLAPREACAQGTAAAAETLFEQGRVELVAKNYDSACAKLRQSDTLDPALGTKLNLAECEAARGHTATAWELYQSVEQKLATTDPRYPIAKQGREREEARLPRLLLVLARGAPVDTSVSVGGTALGAGAFGIPLPFDPGAHELTVTAAGRSPVAISVVLEPGKITTLNIAPGPAQAVTAPIAAPPAAARQVDPRSAAVPGAPDDHTTLGFVLGGVGVVGLATGAVAGALTLRAQEDNRAHCDPVARSCDAQGRDAASTGKVLGIVTTAGLAVGAIGVGIGTYFLLSRGEGDAPQTALAATVGPAGGGVALVSRW